MRPFSVSAAILCGLVALLAGGQVAIGANLAADDCLPEGYVCRAFSRFRHTSLLTQIIVVLAVGGVASGLVWRGGWIAIDRPRTGLVMLLCGMALAVAFCGTGLWCLRGYPCERPQSASHADPNRYHDAHLSGRAPACRHLPPSPVDASPSIAPIRLASMTEPERVIWSSREDRGGQLAHPVSRVWKGYWQRAGQHAQR